MHAARGQPLAVGLAPLGARQRGADVGHFGTGLDQEACDQEFGTLVAGDGDARVDAAAGQGAGDRRQRGRLGGADLRLVDAGGAADGFEPGGGAVDADRAGTDDRTAGGAEFTHARRVEGMHRGDDVAVERRVQVAPLARGHLRRDAESHRRQQAAGEDRVDREHLAEQADARTFAEIAARTRDRAGLGFVARVAQHRAGEDVLRLGVRRHAETGHVDADDAHAVDFLGQQVERHAGSGRHAQVDDDDRVVLGRVGELVDGVTDVLEQLAGDQRLRVERDVADAALGAVEVRGEGKTVNAAGRARQDGRRTAHAQADAQRAEGRAHRLRLVVRAAGVIGGEAGECGTLAGGPGRLHRLLQGRGAFAVAGRRLGGRRRGSTHAHSLS